MLKNNSQFIYRILPLALFAVALCWQQGCTSTNPPATSSTNSTATSTPTGAPTRSFNIDAPNREIYVGVERCTPCHQREHNDWQKSFHSRAMQPASNDSVVGNFNQVKFSQLGTKAEMYREGDKFFMKAVDQDSAMKPYPVAYTFGAKHMQDYLTVLPNGRIQVLPVYYHITGKSWVDFTTMRQGQLSPSHPFYWTNFRRAFNKECFDCHVTAMEVNYDVGKDLFDTRWTDLSVACESCHGPGAQHAQAPQAANIVNPAKLDRDRQMAVCGRCHGPKSPDFSIYSNRHRFFPGDNYDDLFVPLFPVELGVEDSSDFYADGRPNNSSFEYQALIQSRCYLNSQMSCLTCHSAPHNAKAANELTLAGDDNAMCAKCHEKLTANLAEHTKHKPEGAAAKCVSCHMPKIIPGVLDKFADHSIDIPNPDNTRDFKIPNACNDCHQDKPVDWAISEYRKLYSDKKLIRRKVLAAAFTYAARPEAARALTAILANRQESPFLRANAATLLSAHANENSVQLLVAALRESNYLIRLRAAATLGGMRELVGTNPQVRDALAGLLNDANVMVRLQAADALREFNDERGLQAIEALATGEYRDWFRPHAVLANVYYRAGDLARARSELEKTLADKPDYIEAIKLLAVIAERQGDHAAAQAEWRKILRFEPANPEAREKTGQKS